MSPVVFMPPSQAMQYVHPGFSHSCALQTSRSLFLCRVPSRGGLCSVVWHKSDFGNQEIRQLEPWNLAQWEIVSLVPGNVLWRKCIGGLGAKINQLINRHLCEITRGPPPLTLHLHHTHIQTALLPSITPTHPLPYLKIFCADRMACSTPCSASDSGTDRAYLKYSSYRQVFKSGSNSMHLWDSSRNQYVTKPSPVLSSSRISLHSSTGV